MCRFPLCSLPGMLLVAAATGVMQYLATVSFPHELQETLHRTAAWGLVAYLVLHVATRIAAGGTRRLLSILLPRRAFLAAGALATVLALGLADRLLLGTLELAHTDTPPRPDGDPGDAQWQQARPVRIRLANGANLPGGETEVTLRGLHDGKRVYLLCEWDDPTLSRKHVPLLKTEDGWRIVQTAYRRADESRYYEDKLALMLAPSNPLAAMASVHLGAHPLRGQPGTPGGRGLHYTTDGSILDVWH